MAPVDGLRVRLLGPLEVIMTGRPIVVDTRKALAIVAIVAAEGRPFARDELAAMFWPEADDDAARGALRRTLSTLRAAVGSTGLGIDRARVALDATVSVDLADVERLAGSSRLADLERAASLARGPFLAGFAIRDSPAFDDWQASRAVRVDRLMAELFDRLADARLAAGDPTGAAEAARRRVDLDPLDEPGQRRLIELLGATGDRSGAIRQYRSLVAVFDRELGVAPLQETTDLYDAIREERGGPVRVVDPAPAQPDRRRAGTPLPNVSAAASILVGRDAELGTLLETWRHARPDGRTAVLEGEAGIGKTRLGEALADTVRGAGGVVLAARGFPGEAGIAYGPMAGLIRAGLAGPDGVDRLRALDGTARAELGRLTGLPAELRPDGPVATGRAGGRVRLLAALADAITALVTGPAPGLIWLDDLHLADDPTREAIAYLARRLAGRPLLLLVAWRREDLTAEANVVADDLVRMSGTAVIRLERLDRSTVAEIVRASGRPGFDDASIDSVFVESEGLPLHVVEALASDDPASVSVTGGVQALLRERVGSVGQTAAQVLAAASVIGRTFDLAMVRHTSGRSEEETVEAIEELTRRGIVRELPVGPGDAARYDFSHGRLRDVAYEGTSMARRRLLHARTADALRSVPSGPGRDDLSRFALIAGHEREAGRNREAAAAFLDAAERAEAVFANREAIDHLGSALALGHPEIAAIHARIGELSARLGAYPAAITSLETAAALADPADLPAIEVALGRVNRRRGDLTAAASHLDAALASPALDPGERTRALVERCVVALRAGDLPAAAEIADRARAAAAVGGDPAGPGVAERLVGLVAHARGDLGVAREALERSAAIAAGDPDPTASIAAETALAMTMAADGAVDDAVLTATAVIERCRRIGDRHLEAAVENHLADLLHAAGREDEAMAHLKRAVALFAEVGEGEAERDPGIWALAAW